ncbi:GH25 family lysozyme [Vagococcus carniphilus]|uniref:GH25 family lysozyme n=1 Tax=Vagococcus carniphilus TaxID=218144 RepID=A0AAW8TYT9_9ENTE|nr:GH25 family lysozyme [Vagococcus carniphilus]MDT2832445.1 GH25 family lysozyme [Vagococcus carniphilus]
MFRKKRSHFLLATLVLGSLSVSMTVLAETTQTSEVKETSSTIVGDTVENDLDVTTDLEEKNQPVISEVEKKDTEVSVDSEEVSESEEMFEETEEDEFYYPSNRSDLEPSFRTFAAPRAKAKNDNLSIKDKNKPRADFIDVSSHNFDISVEEYKIIRSYGVKGVAVKLTEATSYRNPYAKKQIANAKAAGLIVSAYHYSWFETTAQAKAEAQYFAKMANELGLPKSTLMINDLEDNKIKYKNGHTENAKAFEGELNRLGFSRVNHYLGLHWIRENRIDTNKLGNEKVWVAAYPFTPTSQQQHTQYGAWQWSSKMTFPGVHGVFDISSDYYGSYSEQTISKPLPPQGNYISDGRYVEITKKNYSRWSSFDWDFRGKTDEIYGKKFQARGRYQHLNGSTYFSLYDNKGTWYGYLNADATTVLNGPQGKYISDGRYVSISKDNYTIWSNLNFSSKKGMTKDVYQKTYQAKGRYEHFNGSTYYSLYDGKGTWIGYLNDGGAKTIPNRSGVYISDGRHVTVTKKNYNTWQNFSWKVRENSSEVYEKTFVAKGRYEHLNGSTYLSLYDEKDTWHGYINISATKVGDGAQGAYISDGRYATINQKDKILFNDFNWKERKSTNEVYEKTFNTRGRYQHMNGKTYYSLYDSNGKWHGYAESNLLKFGNGKQGAYISDGRTVKIMKKNYSVWSNFGFKTEKHNTTNLLNQTFEAKGRYEHFNGSTYLSLFNDKDEWMGYLNANAAVFEEVIEK